MSDFPVPLDRIEDLSFQARAKPGDQGGIWLVNWLAGRGSIVAPWWSPERDRQLREFWVKSDHLSGAIYALSSRMTSIPFKIVAIDQSVREHNEMAGRYNDMLHFGSEFGDGWVKFYERFVTDLLSQDNGAFAEVIGDGDPNGPILGSPLTVANLDSFRCQRTADPEYPVIYHDTDGKTYRLHRTRVMFASQLSSPIVDMFGVGFCAVSRCINVAQTLIDILTYKQEKLGSRPHRSILITRGGLDPRDIQSAFQIAEGKMDSQGLSRYSKIVVAGSATMPEASVDTIELSQLPDGFDEESSTNLGMATIALALGVDARELFPSLSAGATRADALIQHMKQRGKGPGQIMELTESMFNFKVLPPPLRFVFDFQDDAQDRQVAEIRKIRSEKRRQDLAAGTVDVRTARLQMVEDGDLADHEFKNLELDEGRLENGSHVLQLFYSNDSKVRKYLDLGVENPLEVEEHLPGAMLEIIRKKANKLADLEINAKNDHERKPIHAASVALKYLEMMYLQVLWNPEVPPESWPSYLNWDFEMGQKSPVATFEEPEEENGGAAPKVQNSADRRNGKPKPPRVDNMRRTDERNVRNEVPPNPNESVNRRNHEDARANVRD